MNKAIIHISDLHIIDFFDVNGTPVTSFKSWLVTEKKPITTDI